MIDAHEGRDVMTADIPNAFIQAHLPQEVGDERVIMKITGVLVDLMVEMAPEIYGPYVVYENGKKVLYVQVLKALYGMLVAALLWYLKFKKDLEGIGFKFNPYDPCVGNRMVDDKQHTIRFHVDDLMSSHVNPDVNTKFEVWLNDLTLKTPWSDVPEPFISGGGRGRGGAEKFRVKAKIWQNVSKKTSPGVQWGNLAKTGSTFSDASY